MCKTIVLKQNNEITRQKIIKAGIDVCRCAWFTNACWLVYHVGVCDNVHGAGYFGGETETKSVEEELARFVAENKDIVFCDSVDSFIDTINELTNKEKYEK